MKPNQFHFHNHLRTALLVAAATLGCTNALASPAADAQALLRREMAICNSGASTQGRETCVREAQAAYAQNRRGVLADGDANYQRNARLRCETKTGCERAACLARVKGPSPVAASAEEVASSVDICVEPLPVRPE